jgi:hypothetical protein
METPRQPRHWVALLMIAKLALGYFEAWKPDCMLAKALRDAIADCEDAEGLG